MWRRLVRWLGVTLLLALVAIQLVPYGRAHTSPPVTQEPPWNRPETRALAVRACFDCHSNQTVWRWYSHIAPVSWLVQRDVDEGRRKLNYSEWDRGQREAPLGRRTCGSAGFPRRTSPSGTSPWSLAERPVSPLA